MVQKPHPGPGHEPPLSHVWRGPQTQTETPRGMPTVSLAHSPRGDPAPRAPEILSGVSPHHKPRTRHHVRPPRPGQAEDQGRRDAPVSLHYLHDAARCPNCGNVMLYRGDEPYRDGTHAAFYCQKCDTYRVEGLVPFAGKERLPGYVHAAGGEHG